MADHRSPGHYFDAAPITPSEERTVTIDLVDPPLRLVTDRGVFSHGRLDTGTELLLRRAPDLPPVGTFCDLGCGTGAIALSMARRVPAARVVAVDVNARARELCARNAAANDLANVEVAASDEVDPALRFDVLWSNPPIRIGKAELHRLLADWLGRLAPAGTAVLVVQKHLGADSLQRWLTSAGLPTSRLASAKGYRLLQSTNRT